MTLLKSARLALIRRLHLAHQLRDLHRRTIEADSTAPIEPPTDEDSREESARHVLEAIIE